jgi:hypothetical protein
VSVRTWHLVIGVITVHLIGAVASAQPFVWTENAGWMNWYASNGDDQGPMAEPDALSGYAWGENFGWLNLGVGGLVPDRPGQSGEDFGIGIDGDGFLYGFAWGENVGWVNFGPYLDSNGAIINICRCDDGVVDCLDKSCEPARARIRRGRLFGYAWSENLGWLNFDGQNQFVQILCPADVTADGVFNFFDVALFLTWFSESSLRADWNDDGLLDFFDVAGFLFDTSLGCP